MDASGLSATIIYWNSVEWPSKGGGNRDWEAHYYQLGDPFINFS
jgi:hypothetical protein